MISPARQIPSLQQIEDELAFRSLKHFVPYLWRTVETEPYVPNWHLDAICDHLQAVTMGDILRLIINVPPRSSKSLTTSVFWPAWGWLRFPELRWLFSSYAHTLSIRDSVRCRRVLSSPVYLRLMSRYQPKLQLTSDQNEKVRYDNNFGGYRLATSVGGALTGEGGDIIVVDDAHNVTEVESDTVRNGTIQWWDESMSTRLNNPKTGRYVIIMQRSHELDLAGHVLHKAPEVWDHLCLPAEFEGEDRVISSLGFCDPRTVIGESLWPARLTPEVLLDYQSRMTEYAYAGQFQQNPAPREGGMFKVDKILQVDSVRADDIVATVRYWDKAGTDGGDGAQTAGIKIGKLRNGTFVVLDAITGRWEAGAREQQIKLAAERDGHKTVIWVEQEPGSGGKESAQSTTRGLSGYRIRADRPVGNKEARAEPFAAQVWNGNVLVLKRGWTQSYLNELRSFPRGRLRDQVDASSGSFSKLVSMGSGVVIMA